MLILDKIIALKKKIEKKDASTVFFKSFIKYAYDPTESLTACTSKLSFSSILSNEQYIWVYRHCIK